MIFTPAKHWTVQRLDAAMIGGTGRGAVGVAPDPGDGPREWNRCGCVVAGARDAGVLPTGASILRLLERRGCSGRGAVAFVAVVR